MTSKLTGGVIPPLATPLTSDLTVDETGLNTLINYVLDGGVQGIFIGGSTGEGSNLTHAQWRRLCELTVKHVQSRVPVLAGIIASGTSEAVELSREAHALGADYVVVTTSFYLRHGVSEHMEHFRRIADASPIPVVVYNVPSTGNVISPEVLIRISEHPNTVGYKDSTGDLETFTMIHETLHNHGWTLFLGTESNNHLATTLGADGTIPGLANVAPHWCTQAFSLGCVGKIDEAVHFQRNLHQLTSIYQQGNGSVQSSAIAGLKETLHQLGICSNEVMPPISRLEPEQRQQIREILSRLHLSHGPTEAGKAGA